MASRPPRVTSRRNQRTTRAPTGRPISGPSVISGYDPRRGFQAPKPPAAPSPASPASAAPAAPAAPQYNVSNLPPDASYDATIAQLQRQRAEQIAQLAQQRAQTLLEYGFTEGPHGTLAVDPRDPFSKSAMMKRAFDLQHRSSGQSMASGGQQYSGAYQNQQDLISRNQLGAQDQMQKALGAFLVRNTQQRGATATNFELAAQQAYGDRVGRFQTNPLYDPATLASSAAEATPATPAAPAGTPAPAAPAAPKPAAAKRRPTRPKSVGVSAWSGYYRR
jgi:hypothetical protein